MLPNTAGSTKLIHQIPTVAASMPTVLSEKWWKRYRPTCPLSPSSTSVIDGMTVITQKNRADIQKPSIKGILTFIQ